MLFDVRVIAFDSPVADPVDALVRVFKVERAIAKELVSRLPRVIKRGVPIETAQRFCDVLERMGARTEIVMSPAGAKEPEPARAPEPVRAPEPEPLRGAVQRAAPPRTRQSMPKVHQALPTPKAALGGALQQGPANANAHDRARASRPSSTQSSSGSVMFSLPEPVTQDGIGLLRPGVGRPAEPPRSSAESPMRARMRGEELGAVRVRHGLPEPREPDPLEADIDGLVERALGEAPTRPSRRPTIAQEPEESRITRTQMLVADSTPPTGRSTVLPEISAHHASAPAQVTPVHAAPVHTARTVDANFRPARPASELEPAAPPVAAIVASPVAPLSAAPLSPAPLSSPLAAPLPAPLHTPAAAPQAALVTHTAVKPAPTTLALPAMVVHGPSVDLKQAELDAGKKLANKLWGLSVFMYLALALITLGLSALCSLAAFALDGWRRWSRVRAMQGSALPVGQAQLPELYACVKQFAVRLDLKTVPRLYLGRRATSDVIAVPLRGELHVLLDGDMLASHVETGSTHVVSFLLAHELSRFALGHRKRMHAALAYFWPMVRRFDALSADAAATQLLVDRSLAQRALLGILAGTRMAPLLDFAELDRQTASHERAAIRYTPALDDGPGFLLARIYHMQHGWVQVRENSQL
jgi:hypothetical protein